MSSYASVKFGPPTRADIKQKINSKIFVEFPLKRPCTSVQNIGIRYIRIEKGPSTGFRWIGTGTEMFNFRWIYFMQKRMNSYDDRWCGRTGGLSPKPHTNDLPQSPSIKSNWPDAKSRYLCSLIPNRAACIHRLFGEHFDFLNHNVRPTWRHMNSTFESALSDPHSKTNTKPLGVLGVLSIASSQKEISRLAYVSWCVIWYKFTWVYESLVSHFYLHLHCFVSIYLHLRQIFCHPNWNRYHQTNCTRQKSLLLQWDTDYRWWPGIARTQPKRVRQNRHSIFK